MTKSKGRLLLLYIPALVNVYAFSISQKLAEPLYHLQNTSFGWINTSGNSFFDCFFNIYYAGYTLASITLIFVWGKKSKEATIKKQSRILMISYGVALILGTFTDIIANSYVQTPLPQLAPLIIMIPISAMFYLTKRYHMFNNNQANDIAEKGYILNEKAQSKIYYRLANIYFLLSLVFFAIRFFGYHASIKTELMYGSVGVIVGFSILWLRNLKMKNEIKDRILFGIIGVSIPYILFRYFYSDSSSIWAIPFVFLTISVVFVQRKMIIFVGCITLLSEFIILIKASVFNSLDIIDYFIRIGITSIVIWLTVYVNKIYVNRLNEIENHVNLQKMVTRISGDFVTINESNFREKIENLLLNCCKQFNVDRAFLLVYSNCKELLEYKYECCKEDIDSLLEKMSVVSLENFSWLMNQINDSGLLHIENTQCLPLEATEDKNELCNLQIKSLLMIPVSSCGTVKAYLGFQCVKNCRTWKKEHLELLEVFQHLLANAFTKIDNEKEINQLAYFDALTNLPNRLLFRNRLEQAIYQAERSETIIGVLFIDLDSFKEINDTMGHDSGDELLKLVAERLKNNIRKSDTVSRFGGDEFLIMLTNLKTATDIIKIAETIIGLFKNPFSVNNQEIFITASLGISVFPIDGDAPEALIKNADMSMYFSKEQGKNLYTFYSRNLNESVIQKTKLTNHLYRALEKKELALYYQPQIDIKTKKIIGLEALVRWLHPELGIILPSVFIHISEETGLIHPIGEWLLKTACQQNKEWQDLGYPAVKMAVNLSVEQLRNPNLVHLVQNVIEETGLQAQFLELEITEGVTVKEPNKIIKILNDLKELGVKIAIDDFGTEYSSLSRLKDLPVDRLKLDMQFIKDISSSDKDEEIINIIIQLGKNLGLKVIAEGVETETQLKYLENHHCDEIQGYYFYKPMTKEEIEVIFRNI